MVNVKHITLTSEELEKCREFSMRSASSQQAIEFGQHTTKARSVKEIARDNLIGKIAEVAFSKMMKENYTTTIMTKKDACFLVMGRWNT